MSRTVRSVAARVLLFARAGGRCERCASSLGDRWHADHVRPWAAGGRTELNNLQALCERCNLRKGKSMSIEPRKFWKDVRAVLATKIANNERDLAIQVECGAGKTSLVSAVAHDLSRAGVIDGVVWLVPRTNLVRSAVEAMTPRSKYWALLGMPPAEARCFEINGLLDGNIPDPARGSFGYAASYDAINANMLPHLEFARRRRILLVSDETQFCAVNQPFGRVLERLRAQSAFSVFMSGDFDREDRRRVACVRYVPRREDLGELVTDYEEVALDVNYTLYDALADRAILPVDFSYGSGSVAFHRSGRRVEVSSLASAGADTSAAVWAALNSAYARHLLSECVRSWRAHRADGALPSRVVKPNPNAQLMVVTASQHQAEAIRRFMIDELGFAAADVALVISDNTEASDLLARYCAGKIPVAVTVAMAYVGTDAPQMSHLCVLTHYRSKAWLHQLFARVWRRSPGLEWDDDYCVAFCPDDARLRGVVDELRLAQQVGVATVDDDDEESSMGDGGRQRSGDAVVVESSTLTAITNRFEFATTPMPVMRTDVTTRTPDAKVTREALRSLGWEDDAIEGMLAVATRPGVDAQPLHERLDDLKKKLEKYQRRTAFMIAQISGGAPDFRAVNSALKTRMGRRDRDVFSEADYHEALAVHAPSVREDLMKQATAAPRAGTATG